MLYSQRPESRLMPFETIVAATEGDVDAMNKVLKHFEGYIVKMSTRIFYDEYGLSYRGVDYDLKQRIENRLIDQISRKFQIR